MQMSRSKGIINVQAIIWEHLVTRIAEKDRTCVTGEATLDQFSVQVSSEANGGQASGFQDE